MICCVYWNISEPSPYYKNAKYCYKNLLFKINKLINKKMLFFFFFLKTSIVMCGYKLYNYHL